MSDVFQQALDSTLLYLGQLRERGVRHVAVSPETLTALAAEPNRAMTARKPAASAKTAPAAGRRKAPPVPAPAAAPSAPAAASPAKHSPAPSAGGGDKESAMAALRERVLKCQLCPHLASSRTQVVFGVGTIHTDVMFVGEAPGADEDRQGEPFVGRAGQLLTRIIETMGLSRETVFIGNVLKCRPDTPGQTSGNRKPKPEEMEVCLPYLREQIEIIQPKVLVALGVTAMEGLFGRTLQITKARGNWQEFQGIPVMPTYHPAYLLRNQSLSEKRKVWEDMLKVMERVGMPISEKQRNYFLTK
ncbi:MAG: Type-4 uracil-DNA glycosylase [Verrucomicrobiota bacterium]|jgi:DNA polymerase